MSLTSFLCSVAKKVHSNNSCGITCEIAKMRCHELAGQASVEVIIIILILDFLIYFLVLDETVLTAAELICTSRYNFSERNFFSHHIIYFFYYQTRAARYVNTRDKKKTKRRVIGKYKQAEGLFGRLFAFFGNTFHSQIHSGASVSR